MIFLFIRKKNIESCVRDNNSIALLTSGSLPTTSSVLYTETKKHLYTTESIQIRLKSTSASSCSKNKNKQCRIGLDSATGAERLRPRSKNENLLHNLPPSGNLPREQTDIEDVESNVGVSRVRVPLGHLRHKRCGQSPQHNNP